MHIVVVSLSVACVLTVSEEGSLIARGHSKMQMLLVRAVAPPPPPCQYKESQHSFTWSEALLSEQALLGHSIGGRAMLVHALLWTFADIALTQTPELLQHVVCTVHSDVNTGPPPLPRTHAPALPCPCIVSDCIQTGLHDTAV